MDLALFASRWLRCHGLCSVELIAGALQPAVDPNMFLLIQQKLDFSQGDVKNSLVESLKQHQTFSHHMTSTVRDVTERLIKIEETNKQVLSFCAARSTTAF